MHYMIDLETLSTRMDAAIIQIGVAAFNEDEVVKSFRWDVHPEGHIDASTVAWWFGQIEQGVPNPLIGKRVPLRAALTDMVSRMKELETVWAHRSTFDLPIIGVAFHQRGIEKPWDHKQIRDTVTLAMMYPDVPRVVPEAAHDAEADARAQAQWMVNIIKRHKEVMS